MVELTPDIREEINQGNLGFKVNQDQGVLIVDVASNSAARAGLRAGDIITEIRSANSNTNQVQEQVERTPLDNLQSIGINCKYHSQTRTLPTTAPT